MPSDCADEAQVSRRAVPAPRRRCRLRARLGRNASCYPQADSRTGDPASPGGRVHLGERLLRRLGCRARSKARRAAPGWRHGADPADAVAGAGQKVPGTARRRATRRRGCGGRHADIRVTPGGRVGGPRGMPAADWRALCRRRWRIQDSHCRPARTQPRVPQTGRSTAGQSRAFLSPWQRRRHYLPLLLAVGTRSKEERGDVRLYLVRSGFLGPALPPLLWQLTQRSLEPTGSAPRDKPMAACQRMPILVTGCRLLGTA